MQVKLKSPWPTVSTRAWYAALALGAAGLVAVGMELQHLLRLSPCPLCIFQRLLYMLIAGLALGAALLPVARHAFGGLIVLTAGGGMAVAGYQTWMQAFPQLAKECSFTDPNLIERLVDWLGMQMPSLFLATGFCTSKEWEFLGLSMANWSLLIYAGMAAYVALLMRCRK